MFLILSSTLAYTSNERKTLSLCYPSVSLVPRTGPGTEVLSVCQMEAAMCLVMDGPGRKIEQDGAELTTRNTVKSRQRVGRKGFWNYLRYIRKWVCELIKKKKKSVFLSCSGKRFICILFLDSTYMCWYMIFVLFLFLTYGEVGWTGRLGQTCIHYHVWNRQLVGSCFIAHGAQLRALRWPRGVRWGEGKGSSGGGHICTRITDLPWRTGETNTTF